MRDVSQITYERKVDVTSTPVRCIYDGAIMDVTVEAFQSSYVTVEAFQASLDEGPSPVYVFECLLCDNETEIW